MKTTWKLVSIFQTSAAVDCYSLIVINTVQKVINTIKNYFASDHETLIYCVEAETALFTSVFFNNSVYYS